MQSFSKPYPSRYGLPILEQFDPQIFTLRYFGECMACTFCSDSCCQFGVDIELDRMNAILAKADDLERYLGSSRNSWFRLDPEDVGLIPDEDYPGGAMTRTSVHSLPPGRSPHNEEACVFLDPTNRGCRLHRYAMENAIDVHDIKPMICLMFPIVFEYRALVPGIEFESNELICRTDGPTIYQTARDHLRYYFGEEMVAELDSREPEFSGPAAIREGVALPVIAAS